MSWIRGGCEPIPPQVCDVTSAARIEEEAAGSGRLVSNDRARRAWGRPLGATAKLILSSSRLMADGPGSPGLLFDCRSGSGGWRVDEGPGP
jgi:hypothetical protein